jgi:hypothetical protein
MELEEKQAVAKALLERHAAIYDVAIPKKLGVIYASASAFSMEGKCAKLDLPGYEEGTFRLVACPPSWEAASATNLDDAVVGEDGEWEAAGDFIPIFNVDQSGYIVVKVDDANLAVGFFNEENFREDGDGYKTGVFMIAKSLEEFRTALVHVDEEIWDEIGDELEEGEDGDDEEEDEDE